MQKIDIHNFIDIPGYPGYQIKIATNEVYSFRSKRILKISIQASWHLNLSIYRNRECKTMGIHRLVMLIKEWLCPEWMEVCHYDWNPENNYPDNLRYDTKSENIKDKVRHGTHALAGKFWANSYFSKKINQYSIHGDLIQEWWAWSDCSRALKIDGSTITKCCRWKTKTAWWFVFKYA